MAIDDATLSPEDLALKIAGIAYNKERAYLEQLMELPILPTNAWDIMKGSDGRYDLNAALSLAERNRQLNRSRAMAEQASIERLIAMEDDTGYKIDPVTGEATKVKETLIPLAAWKGYQEYQKMINNFSNMAIAQNPDMESVIRAVLYNRSRSTAQAWGTSPLNDWQLKLLYG